MVLGHNNFEMSDMRKIAKKRDLQIFLLLCFIIAFTGNFYILMNDFDIVLLIIVTIIEMAAALAVYFILMKYCATDVDKDQ